MGFLRSRTAITKASFSPNVAASLFMHARRQPTSMAHMFNRNVHRHHIARLGRYRAPLGDPGFFGSIIGKLDSAVSGAASFIPGGNVAVGLLGRQPGGGLVGKLSGFLHKHKAAVLAGGAGMAAAGTAGVAAMLHAHGAKGGMRMTATGRRRYRRMNPLNYHALKRSARRIHMASKIMRTVFHQAKHVRAPKRAPRGVRPQRRRGRFVKAA